MFYLKISYYNCPSDYVGPFLSYELALLHQIFDGPEYSEIIGDVMNLEELSDDEVDTVMSENEHHVFIGKKI